MSSESEPISPARFAAALPSLPLSTLRLKVLEIRTSISHLLYSNAELKPFADAEPADEVCVEAIRENEVVLVRMLERITVLKEEVENRGARWEEFEGASAVAEDGAGAGTEGQQGDGESGEMNGGEGQAQGQAQGQGRPGGEDAHPAWSDGTFQVGTIRLGPSGGGGPGQQPNGVGGGGSLSDAELARQLEERMRVIDDGDEDGVAENGLHL